MGPVYTHSKMDTACERLRQAIFPASCGDNGLPSGFCPLRAWSLAKQSMRGGRCSVRSKERLQRSVSLKLALRATWPKACLGLCEEASLLLQTSIAALNAFARQ